MYDLRRRDFDLITRSLSRAKVLEIALLLLLGALWQIKAAPAEGLGTLVVVGDSLSAGFQNFSLYDTAQKQGFAALIAKQAGMDLQLPLISKPGIPGMLTIDSKGVITRASGTGSRENPTVQTFNLSVPGFTLDNALSYTVNISQLPPANPIDGMALSILATPGSASQPPCAAIGATATTLTLSEVACAVNLHPDTIIVSVGNNDALQSLTFGVPPTDPGSFTTDFAILLGALSSTGGKIVVANIPDVTALPFLVPAPAFQALCGSLPAGVTSADYLVTNIVSPTAATFNICTNYVVRNAQLIADTQNAIRAYNAGINQLAQMFGAVVVDVNGLFAEVAAHGYKVRGDTLTTAFLGGLFSLDAIHPTATGYAILANKYIDTMNEQLNTHIKEVNVGQVEKTDPLVFDKH
jgi:lysophospholipase L1-like esterase